MLVVLQYDLDIVDENVIRELARRFAPNDKKTERWLRYNRHFCHLTIFNSDFKVFPCPTCVTFFAKLGKVTRKMNRCSGRVRHVCPKNVHEAWETFIVKLESFGVKYTSKQFSIKNQAIFDWERIFLQGGTFKNWETATWIDKHVSISIIFYSNLVVEPFLLWNTHPHPLVGSDIRTMEVLASQSKAQTILLFPES